MAEYMDEELRHKIIACIYRNRDFCLSTADYLKPSYFDESPVEKNIVKIGLDYWMKYNSVCSPYVFKESLKSLVVDKFVKGDEIAIYASFYKHIQSLDISDVKYVADTLISFIKKQEFRKAIENAVSKHIPKNDFDSIDKEFKKIAEMSALQEVAPYNFYGLDEIEARAERRHRSLTKVERGIKTGIKKMDDILPKGGFYKKELYNFMAPAKRGKCVTRDTIIYTSNGIGRIGDLIDDDHEPGTFVRKIVPILGYDGMDKTSHVYNSGYGSTKIITLDNGTFLEGTPHHPVLVYNDGQFYWKELQTLNVGECVVGKSGDFIFGTNEKIEYKSIPESEATIPDRLTEDICSLIGLIMPTTDWNPDMSGFVFYNQDEAILDEFVRLMKSVFNLTCYKDYDRVAVNNVSVCYFFSEIGIDYYPQMRRIPDCIKCANQTLYLAFLRSLIDCIFKAEILKVTVKKSPMRYYGEFLSRNLMLEVQASLNNVGVYSVIRKNKLEIPCAYSIERYSLRVGFLIKDRKSLFPETSSYYSKEAVPVSYELMADFYGDIKDNGYVNEQISSVEKRLLQNYMIHGTRVSMKFLREMVYRFKDSFNSYSYNIIKEIVNNGYVFHRITKIQNSTNETVDVTVPQTHSFIGNGIVNHNTTALTFFANIATLDGYNVAYFTCETSIEVLSDRIDAMNADVAIRAIDAKYKEVRDSVRAMRPANGSLRFYEYPTKCLKCSDIENHVRKLQNSGVRIDMIISDYAGIMKPEYTYGESLREEASIYEGLRGLATKFDCPVLTASQINRSGTDKSIITGTDKAGSYEAIMVADYNISLSASAEDLKRNQLTIHFAECRNVERRTLKINTSYETGRFFKKFIEEVE